jgi:hypothetical protein
MPINDHLFASTDPASLFWIDLFFMESFKEFVDAALDGFC